MIGVAKTILVGAAYNVSPGETNNGKKFIKFALRVWRPQKNREDKVSFFNIVAYAGAAEVLVAHIRNGKILYLDCTADEYKDSNGGSKVQFIVNEFTFLGDGQND